MAHQVAIIGDGQMGLVMADALVANGAAVRLWGPFEADVRQLAGQRVSPRMPRLRLTDSVHVTADAAEALADAEFIVSAIPTQYLREVWTGFAKLPEPYSKIVSVTKGIEIGTLLRPTQVIEQALKSDGPSSTLHERRSICALSGPSIAAELAQRLPASLVAASTDEDCAQHVQELFTVPWLRIYRNDDVIGVEMAAATKNVIALAAGMIDGLGAGVNAKSALLARGLAEIARLGVALGAKLDTFFGVAGVGDLATTCFASDSRNRTCGERLGRGESLDAILSSTKSIVEGVPTAKAVLQLAQRQGVDMPITTAVNAILFEGLPPQQAIRELMGRQPKAESFD